MSYVDKTNPSAGFKWQMVTSTQVIHILLAEDDTDDREMFQELLNEFSVSAVIRIADNGESLMNLLSTLPDTLPHYMIFLDIHMPRKNGIECLTEIRSKRKFDTVPIFMFSGSTSQSDIDAAFEHGANLYISKDLFLSDLKHFTERLFSVHWKDHLAKISKEQFVLNKSNGFLREHQ